MNQLRTQEKKLQTGVLNIDFTETVEEDNTELLELLKDKFKGYIVEELDKMQSKLRVELDDFHDFSKKEHEQMQVKTQKELEQMSIFQIAMKTEIEEVSDTNRK